MHRPTTVPVLSLGILCILGGLAHATPTGDLWQAICQVESEGDPNAYNPKEGAAGIVQIRPVCLRDVNRMTRLQGLDQRFTSADRYDPAVARRMWRLYLDYYGEVYARRTGRDPTPEVYARIWNGGPEGWRKADTQPYWQRVQEVLAG